MTTSDSRAHLQYAAIQARYAFNMHCFEDVISIGKTVQGTAGWIDAIRYNQPITALARMIIQRFDELLDESHNLQSSAK